MAEHLAKPQKSRRETIEWLNRMAVVQTRKAEREGEEKEETGRK